MQVDSEDRYVEEESHGGIPKLPLALAVLALVIGIAWYFSGNNADTETASAPITTPVPANPPTPLQPETPPAPDIPALSPVTVVAERSEPDEIIAPEPVLSLEDSDPLVRDALADSFTDSVFEQALRQDDLLERGTAFIDAAGNGSILSKVFPFPAIEGKYSVVEVAGKPVADPASYQRYNAYAASIGSLNPDTLASVFHQFRPQLEQAYASLGYEAEDMDNSLIRALDEVIAAPLLEEPAALKLDITTYTYEDESLENLSPIAKQLMRMGPENQAIIQAQAKALRAALLGQ
ncbi:MAG: DUF3014 domain-containing protein [Halioglobus sp.]